tara:strand:- start:546 stop:785 length:240 start_codon:yes stop_codon:yes gene_type:complete
MSIRYEGGIHRVKLTPREAAQAMMIDQAERACDSWPGFVIDTDALTEREITLINEQLEKQRERILRLFEKTARKIGYSV